MYSGQAIKAAAIAPADLLDEVLAGVEQAAGDEEDGGVGLVVDPPLPSVRQHLVGMSKHKNGLRHE